MGRNKHVHFGGLAQLGTRNLGWFRRREGKKEARWEGVLLELPLQVSEGSKVRPPGERWLQAGSVSVLNNVLTHLHCSLDKKLKILGVCDQLSQLSKLSKLFFFTVLTILWSTYSLICQMGRIMDLIILLCQPVYVKRSLNGYLLLIAAIFFFLNSLFQLVQRVGGSLELSYSKDFKTIAGEVGMGVLNLAFCCVVWSLKTLSSRATVYIPMYLCWWSLSEKAFPKICLNIKILFKKNPKQQNKHI